MRELNYGGFEMNYNVRKFLSKIGVYLCVVILLNIISPCISFATDSNRAIIENDTSINEYVHTSYGTVYSKYILNDKNNLSKNLFLNDACISEGIIDFCVDNQYIAYSSDDSLFLYNFQDGTSNNICTDVQLRDLMLYSNYIYGVNDSKGLSQLYIIDSRNNEIIKTNYTNVNAFTVSDEELNIDMKLAASKLEEIGADKIDVSTYSAVVDSEEIDNSDKGLDNILNNCDSDISLFSTVNNDMPVLMATVTLSSLQPAMFVMDTLYVTQGAYGSYSHSTDNAFDFDGSLGGGVAKVYSPFDGTVRYKETNYNTVWVESNEIVQYADGRTGMLTVLFMHDNDISNITQGQSLYQGQYFYDEGGKGPNGSGQYPTHLHLECINGTAGSYAWHKRGDVYPNDALYIYSNTNVGNSGGYTWRIWSGVIVPETPTITSVAAISTSSLKVKWTAVDNANSYEVYRRKSGESWSDAVLVATSKSTSYTDEGLDAGTKYYYRVVAVNGSFKSEQSESNSSYTKPKVITAVNFSDITTDSVTLEWSAVKSAVSYDIYKRKSGESWSGSEPIANTVSTYFVDTDLEAGEKYYYRIITVNESTESEISESFSVYARLNTPIIKSASKIAPTSLEISWDKVDKATSYEVYRREAGDSWSGIEPIANVATTYFNDSELKAGTRYYYRIVALNGATSSVQSESFRVYTAYNISYNTNDGTDTLLFQSKIYDESISLSDIIPLRDGYYFKEWNTEADGSGISYNPGAIYTENKNMVLYAQWEKQIPSIKSTVTKTNLEYIIETKIENISSTSYEIIIAGYKGGKFISMEKVSYNEQNSPYIIKGDIDEIKVMVWDGLSSMKPLCEAEVIPSNEFIVE